MAYENIRFRKPNMTIANGYFYMFDESNDMLIEKIDDGDTSFSYPSTADISANVIQDSFDIDGPLNDEYWNVNGPGVVANSGKVRLSVPGVDSRFDGINKIVIPGNFDIRVDFDIISGPSTNSWGFFIRAQYADGSRIMQIVRAYNGSAHRYYRQYWNGSSWVDYSDVLTSDTSGKLRITRSGNTFNFYYWNGTSWSNVGGGLTYALNHDLYPVVAIGRWGGLPAATVDTDNFYSSVPLGDITQTHYDGSNFWTLYDNSSAGFTARRWRIENKSVVDLKDTFIYASNSSNTYNSDAFGVEHYITEFGCTVSGGNTSLCLDEYYDTVVSSGITLTLGPNEDGEIEDVTVSDISGTDVIITSGTQYTYNVGDQISFYKSLFVFNNYDGLSSARGTLFRFDAYTGDYISSDADADYKNVDAAVFARIQNAIQDYPDAHTLLYIKDTNAKLRNMSDLLAVAEASTVNDDFSGNNFDPPNTTRWTNIVGSSFIWDNKLKLDSGNDETRSNYYLLGDFDVQISGTIDAYNPTLSGSFGETYHYMDVFFPSQSNDHVSIGYYTASGVSNHSIKFQYNGADEQSDAVGNIHNYFLRITRSGDDMNFYYKTVVSGVPDVNWTSLGNYTMFTNDCKVELGVQSGGPTASGIFFDDLIYNSGRIVYIAATVPYYGIANMDNIRANQIDIIPVYDVAVQNRTLYRLQDEGTYYGVNNDWGSQYNYQVTPLRSFLDSITVTAYPVILPANGRNIAEVDAVVLDQYGNGVIFKPVTWTDTDAHGYTTINPAYTDIFFGTGKAVTYYRAGLVPHTVTVEGTATQYD